MQYQVGEQVLNSNEYNVEILNNETTSHYPKPPFHNMINAKFGTLQTQVLVDTGATLSCIRDSFLDKIPKKFIKKLPHQHIIIHRVGGFKKHVKDQVELTFTINGRKFTERFYSLPNSYNVILSLPFPNKYNAVVNLASSEITLDGHKL